MKSERNPSWSWGPVMVPFWLWDTQVRPRERELQSGSRFLHSFLPRMPAEYVWCVGCAGI